MTIKIQKRSKKVNFGITIDEELAKEIKSLAKHYQTTTSSFVEQLLSAHIAELKQNIEKENK